jgi:hypothetical protein
MATTPESILLDLLKLKLNEVFTEKPAKIEFKNKDIVIYTKDKSARSDSFSQFKNRLDKVVLNPKAFVKSYKITPSSKSSIGVFQLFSDRTKTKKIFLGDILFKPIINKGSGGKLFENELEADLNNYFKGTPIKELKHSDTITTLFSNKKFITYYKLNTPSIISQLEAKAVGSQNTKRTAVWSNNKLLIGNNTGEAVSDINILYKGQNKIFCSLKFTDSYYIYNGSTIAYFDNDSIKPLAYSYFGLSGAGMAGFGSKYAANVASPKSFDKIKANLADIINQALGRDVVIINKITVGKNDIDVIQGDNHKVNITTTPIYIYPESGKRKYASINFESIINNDKYKISFQFRGTTEGALTPRYLRILVKHL